MNIPKSGLFSAFSLIVDINSFTRLVAFHDLSNISNYVHDVLIGSVSAIEDCGGSVIGVMGDAILGFWRVRMWWFNPVQRSPKM